MTTNPERRFHLTASLPIGEAIRGFLVREGSPNPRAGPRLLDRVRQAIRVRHYSRKTEKAYVGWIKRFVIFHGRRHPAEMGAPEVTRYLSYLATQRRVSASTQNQALNALVFLYKHVLKQPLNEKINAERAPRKVKIPGVLAREETKRIIDAMTGIHQLVVKLLYGSGLRIIECLRLRVHE